MNWQEILIILVPILSLLAWVYNRIDKQFERLEKKMDLGFKETREGLYSLDMRLTKLEGRFEERGYWESRKTGTHDER